MSATAYWSQPHQVRTASPITNSRSPPVSQVSSSVNMVTHCRAELEPAKYVQSETAILSATPEKYAVINEVMGEVLAFLDL